jgi:hypothetical protein
VSSNRDHVTRSIKFVQFRRDDEQKNAVWVTVSPMAVPLKGLLQDRKIVENTKRILCEEIDAAYDVFINHQKGE